MTSMTVLGMLFPVIALLVPVVYFVFVLGCKGGKALARKRKQYEGERQYIIS